MLFVFTVGYTSERLVDKAVLWELEQFQSNLIVDNDRRVEVLVDIRASSSLAAGLLSCAHDAKTCDSGASGAMNFKYCFGGVLFCSKSANRWLIPIRQSFWYRTCGSAGPILEA